MTKSERLNQVLNQIAKELNQATSREQAESMNLDKYLFLENNSAYGGYRVVNVGIKNGAHYGAFNGNGAEVRLKAAEMMTKLNSILTGIQLQKQL